MKQQQVTVGMLRRALDRENVPDDWVLVVELPGPSLPERSAVPVWGLGTNRPNRSGPQEFVVVAHTD
jgi:hypothetical protein